MIGCAVHMEGRETGTFLSDQELRKFLTKLDPATTTTVAFNAMFDSCILAWRYNFIPARMLCTMRLAVALRGHMLRRHSLAAVGEALGVGRKGDFIASAKGKRRADMVGDPVFWRSYVEYAINDNLMNREIFRLLINELPAAEWRIMNRVLRCAVEPKFVVDTDMLAAHMHDLKLDKIETLLKCTYPEAAGTFASVRAVAEVPGDNQKKAARALERLEVRHEASMDNMATALRSNDKFKALLEAHGVEIEYKPSATDPGRMNPAFAKTDSFMAQLHDHPDPAVQALASARLGLRSTIEQTRGERMLGIARLAWPSYCGGNMPVPLKYAAAHTHRFGGDWAINMQNLPAAGRGGKVSKLRKSLCAPPGHKVVVADKAQIECRISAVVCRQESLLDQFRNKQDPYAILAASIFGRPIDKSIDKVERFIGKTGVLGLGYGCGHQRFFSMVYAQSRSMKLGDKFDDLWTPSLAKRSVDVYRAANRNIVIAWSLLDAAISTTWLRGSPERTVFGPVVITKGCIEGPSGLCMRYDNPHYDTETQEYRYSYGGREYSMYGAKMLENIVQFLARINIMHDALRIGDQGYPFVLQAHDELVWIVPDDEVDTCKRVALTEMRRAPSWAPGIPLDAEASHGQNYGEAKT